MQKAFAEDGIRFADRRVTVAVPGAEAMTPEQRRQAEIAAASALGHDQAEDETPGSAPTRPSDATGSGRPAGKG